MKSKQAKDLINQVIAHWVRNNRRLHEEVGNERKRIKKEIRKAADEDARKALRNGLEQKSWPPASAFRHSLIREAWGLDTKGKPTAPSRIAAGWRASVLASANEDISRAAWHAARGNYYKIGDAPPEDRSLMGPLVFLENAKPPALPGGENEAVTVASALHEDVRIAGIGATIMGPAPAASALEAFERQMQRAEQFVDVLKGEIRKQRRLYDKLNNRRLRAEEAREARERREAEQREAVQLPVQHDVRPPGPPLAQIPIPPPPPEPVQEQGNVMEEQEDDMGVQFGDGQLEEVAQLVIAEDNQEVGREEDEDGQEDEEEEEDGQEVEEEEAAPTTSASAGKKLRRKSNLGYVKPKRAKKTTAAQNVKERERLQREREQLSPQRSPPPALHVPRELSVTPRQLQLGIGQRLPLKLPPVVKEEHVEIRLEDFVKEFESLALRLSLHFRIDKGVFVLMPRAEVGHHWISRLLMLRDEGSSIRLAFFTGCQEDFSESVELWLKSDFTGSKQQLIDAIDSKCAKYFQTVIADP